MIAHRATRLLAGSAALAVVAMSFAVPATAQISDDVVLSIMRECARIDDPAARLGCYDNNIRSASAPRNTIPGQVRVQGGTPAPVTGNGAAGFGREDVRTPDRFNAAPNGEAVEIAARVRAVAERGPGIYMVTLEDGAEWLFTRGAGASYIPPRAGSTVEIQRGALGSFLLRFDNQEAVRVRRVR
jgi:hypothetical protein